MKSPYDAGGMSDVAELPVHEDSEPRAGYYISTQDRPAFITDLSSDEIDDVFELMRKDHDRWHLERDGNGNNSNKPTTHSPNGNGQAR